VLLPIFIEKPEKSQNFKMHAARRITTLLPHSFDKDLDRIDHPVLEEKL